jgi:hypothetical protein
VLHLPAAPNFGQFRADFGHFRTIQIQHEVSDQVPSLSMTQKGMKPATIGLTLMKRELIGGGNNEQHIQEF